MWLLLIILLKKIFMTPLNKDTKLLREVRCGRLFKIINGLYETNINSPGYLLAGSIYGHSYISFEYTLSF